MSLLFGTSAVPLNAQVSANAGLKYDIAAEVTISGTVSQVLSKPAQGMLMGSHLLITTVSGQVDASLGSWALVGSGALAVAPGQQVEVTGVMKTLKGDKQVFLARTVKAGSQVFTARNKNGIPVTPQARERMTKKTGQQGEAL
jgi:DNA/RNA endonuclease YhcR with UshA esterase domain